MTNKYQTVGSLVLEICLGFGAWNLGFPTNIGIILHMPEPMRTPAPEIAHPAHEVGKVVVEQGAEQLQPSLERQPVVQPVDLVQPPNLTPAPVAIHPPADQLIKSIEGAMADGLDDAYQAMEPVTQQKFKRVGEETAGAIEKLLEQSKIQIKKIVTLLLRWLRIIPRVNPYYIEQQAKIKADAIVALKHPPRQGS